MNYHLVYNLILVVTIIGSFVISGCNNKTQKADYQVLREKCLDIEVGMNRETVLANLGEPKNIKFISTDSVTQELWFYTDDRLLSTHVYFTLDSAKGVVLSSVCGE